MYDLERFSFTDMMACRSAFRTIFSDSPATVAEACQRVVNFLYGEMGDARGNPACALVRMFKTHPYQDLDPELKAFARRIYPEADRKADLRCLVLLATAGEIPAWNDRHASRGHLAIPLINEAFVEEAPMIGQLIEQFGISVSSVLRPAPTLLLDAKETSFNVFHVPEALGSPYIPAQDEFVARHGIRSVVGFGGLLATGDLFATILFTKVPVSDEVAGMFKVLGLNLKVSILPLARRPLFEAT